MKSPCLLKVAIHADAVVDGETLLWNFDDRHYRTGVKLLDIIFHVLGCQYETLYPEDGKFGSFMNGSWNGMVEMAYRGVVDLVVSEIAITEERKQVVDFSYPFSVSKVTFITEQLKVIYDIGTVLKPFSWEIWSVLGLFHVVMSCTFYFLFFGRYSVFTVALKTFAAFFEQMSFKPSGKFSERMAVIIWLMSMMIVSLIYKANLLSILTFPKLEGIRFIPELSTEVKKGNYECTTYPGAYYVDHMLKSHIQTWKVIGQSLLRNGGTSDIEKALDKDGSKKMSFIGPEFSFMYLKNKYFISEDFFFTEMPAIAMRKDFPYKNKVNKAIQGIYSGGLFEKILEEERFFKVLQNLSDLGSYNVETINALSLQNIKSAFIFLLIGHGFAIGCFIVELFIGKNSVK